jgi:ubiquinone/menaquinone biosynthesis C-methylase UbiE
MTVLKSILMRTFGRPRGTLGKLGGMIMARTNAAFARSTIGLIDIQPADKVLEVGFGPGVGIERLARSAPAGRVAGIDRSTEMLEQAKLRNAEAIAGGLVDLRHGAVENLPFEDSTFDVVLAINSMQVWPDVMAGLREIWRVTRPGGRLVVGFTRHSGQPRAGIAETLSTAGFDEARLVEIEQGFCALALKPRPG